MAWTDGTAEVYSRVKELEEENRDLKDQFCYLDIECERLEKENSALEAEIERLNDRYEKLYLKYDDVINDNKFLKRKNNEQGAEIDMMRKYIHDNNLEFDLLSYSKRKDVE